MLLGLGGGGGTAVPSNQAPVRTLGLPIVHPSMITGGLRHVTIPADDLANMAAAAAAHRALTQTSGIGRPTTPGMFGKTHPANKPISDSAAAKYIAKRATKSAKVGKTSRPNPAINPNGGVGDVPYGPPMPSVGGVAGSAASGATAGGAMSFDQALKYAQSMMGAVGLGAGGVTAPIDAAIKLAQQQGDSAQKQAQRDALTQQGDLATIFGRVGNYLHGLLGTQQAEGQHTLSDIAGRYGQLDTQLAGIGAHAQGDINSELARMGLNGTAATAGQHAVGDTAFARSLAAGDSTALQNKAQLDNAASNDLMRALESNTRVEGTGKVAEAKDQGAKAVQSIRDNLAKAINDLNAQKSNAGQASKQQALSLALQVLKANSGGGAGGATDPLDTLLKQARYANLLAGGSKTAAETKKLLAELDPNSALNQAKNATTANKNKKPLDIALDYLTSHGSSQANTQTMVNLLNLAQAGNPQGKHLHYKPGDATYWQALTKSATRHKLPAADANALLHAAQIAQGLVSG